MHAADRRGALEPMFEPPKRFQDALAKAVSSGTVFDDAATARGLGNFFSQGLACGALTPEEAGAGAAAA